MELRLEHLVKDFSGTKAVNDVSITIQDGKLTGLLGPSGCGKSTTLYLISGLESPTSGRIFFGDRDVTALPPEKRGIGLVFQNYALYPHLTVEQNIAFPLVNHKEGKEEIRRRTLEMARLVQIEDLLKRKPGQLSGGQQQRVAFARALVMGQEILLLDEPLSNLDAKLRVEVRTELRQIQQKFGITTMYVTHDQDEALSMSDIIAVMRRGRIEQIGSPWEIYFRPATRFVADFVGTVNFLEGTAHREADGSLSVDHRGMRLRVDEDTDLQGGEPVTLVVRPEGISLMGLEETVPEGTALRGTIENYSFLGRMIRYWVRVGEEVFVIDDANVDLTGARTGDVQLRLDTRKLHVLKGGGADAAG